MCRNFSCRRLVGVALLVLSVLGVYSRSAFADDGQAPRAASQVYFVTMILQSKADSNVIKPVHSVVSEGSVELAEARFLAVVQRDFPEYKVITTLTSPSTAITAPACVNPLGYRSV